jgi:predicted AAA+ superfamily ATPase
VYVNRSIEKQLLSLSTQFPVVTLVGPRQSGKTTLAKKIFPKKPFVNLDDPDNLAQIQSDPKGVLLRYKVSGVIIDEVQRMPELLSYIQVLADEIQLPGHFILTGSNQLALANSVSQSLAGRTAILSLLPFSIEELKNANQPMASSTDELLIKGFFPKVHTSNQQPKDVYKFYIQTYIEKDVRQLINLKDLRIFQQFLKLCAGRIGQVLNTHSLANELGVTSKTLKEWFSVLEASYIIYFLPPYFENFGKRVMKSPKLYFTDVGLASYLLGISEPDQMARDPLRGQVFENLVVIEFYKSILNNNLATELYYFRDNNLNEVDVIIEIKSSQTFQKQFLKGIHYFEKLVPDKVEKGYLLFAGETGATLQKIKLLNYQDASEVFKD